MRVNVEFSEEQCSQLLAKCGYMTEDVTLYYNPDPNPYNNEKECDPSLLRAVEYKVAYQNGKKPEELEKEYPLVDECRAHLYPTVLDRVVSDYLFYVMVQHSPNSWSHC